MTILPEEFVLPALLATGLILGLLLDGEFFLIRRLFLAAKAYTLRSFFVEEPNLTNIIIWSFFGLVVMLVL